MVTTSSPLPDHDITTLKRTTMTSTPVDTMSVRSQISAQLGEQYDDNHEHERALARTQMVFDLFYDDEPGEPDQAIRDALTDLMHIAAQRSVDFQQALADASRMWAAEREEWELGTD